MSITSVWLYENHRVIRLQICLQSYSLGLLHILIGYCCYSQVYLSRRWGIFMTLSCWTPYFPVYAKLKIKPSWTCHWGLTLRIDGDDMMMMMRRWWWWDDDDDDGDDNMMMILCFHATNSKSICICYLMLERLYW